MASWLVRSSPDRAVRVRALAGDIVLCSWARHFTLTGPLHPGVINRYRRIVGENLTNCWGVTCDGLAFRPGGVEILLAASFYGNGDKLRPDEPGGSKGITLNVNMGTIYFVLNCFVCLLRPRGAWLVGERDCQMELVWEKGGRLIE